MFGAAKYSEGNWKGVEPVRYKDAAMRHLVAYMNGEKNDEESGLPHLAHLACCVLFLLWQEKRSEVAIKPPEGFTLNCPVGIDHNYMFNRPLPTIDGITIDFSK